MHGVQTGMIVGVMTVTLLIALTALISGWRAARSGQYHPEKLENYGGMT
jgi:hypothetical protein